METKKKTSKRSRFLWGIIFFILAAVIGLYLLLPAAIGVITILPGGQQVGSPPPGFEEATLMTGDGVPWRPGTGSRRTAPRSS